MAEIVLSQEEIATAVKRIGAALTKDLKDEKKPPVFLCVMKGALPFYSDLIKCVERDIICDYVQLSSYEGGLSTTGNVRLQRECQTDLTGRTVVIVDDVVDSGLSMQFMVNYINEKYAAKRVLVCALFDKPNSRISNVKVDYCGKILEEPKFLVGYGLDYKQLLRNVPYVYVLEPEDVAKYDAIED